MNSGSRRSVDSDPNGRPVAPPLVEVAARATTDCPTSAWAEVPPAGEASRALVKLGHDRGSEHCRKSEQDWTHNLTVSKTTRAAVYTRISRDAAGRGLGVARQLADCLARAEQEGWDVVGQFEDNDLSASGRTMRPAYLKLRAAMQAREIDKVLVYSMDRLHRNMKELIEWIDLSDETGVGIVAISGGEMDLSSPDGRFKAHIYTAFATAERDKIRQRIQRKHLELAAAGAWPGRRVYGYLADAAVVPEEARVVVEMADRVLAGEGYNSIARDLNSRLVPTLNGGKWRASTIQNILRSPRLAGWRVHHGQAVTKGAWEPILSEELSVILQAKLAPGRSAHTGGRGRATKKLLTGVLVCGNCGTGMVGGFGGRTRVANYRCPKNEGAEACGRMTVVARKAEEFLMQAACAALDLVVAQDVAELDDGSWLRKSRELSARNKQLGQAFAAGKVGIEAMIEAQTAINAEQAKLEPPRPRQTRVGEMTGEVLESSWSSLPVHEQRNVLLATLGKVRVRPVRITTGRRQFDPERFDISWQTDAS